MTLKLTFLGTGTSHGIPVIACDCPVCLSADHRNQRYRCSAWVQWRGKSLLIDTATELRLQACRAGLRRVDGVLFTHAHQDHIGGLDDVRRFNDLQRTTIPCYGNAETTASLRQKYAYAFEPTQFGGGKPRLDLRTVRAGEPFEAAGVPVLPVGVLHGSIEALGYRMADFAYVTDVSAVPEASLPPLEGLELLVIDALRWRPHPTHFSIEEALEVVRRVRPTRTLFTHICHDLDHEKTNRALPEGVSLAYDGLVVEMETDV